LLNQEEVNWYPEETERRPIELLDPSDSDNNNNSEASFKRWGNRRPEPPLRDETDTNGRTRFHTFNNGFRVPIQESRRPLLTHLDFSNIDHLLLEDTTVYLGPP
jgi:hypothetical protein